MTPELKTREIRALAGKSEPRKMGPPGWRVRTAAALPAGSWALMMALAKIRRARQPGNEARWRAGGVDRGPRTVSRVRGLLRQTGCMRSTRERLRALGEELGQLGARSMESWFAAGLDPLGGAHGFLDRRFRPVTDESARGPSGEILGDQSLVQQARHLYACSLYAERRQAEPRAAAFAHRLSAHLCQEFTRGDAFVNLRSREGIVRSAAVQLYAQGFAVYALSTYGRVLRVPAASERALSLFGWLDRTLHDGRHGGYEQRHDGGWLPFVSAPPGAAKCANTHLHTLEAWTALLRTWPEEQLVRERTLELATLIATRLRQPAGNLHPFFDAAWRPVGPARVSYGHDVESAWLLLDALDVLEATGEVSLGVATDVRQAARALVQHALRTGWDPAGGFFDHGVPEGATAPPRVLDRAKV